MKPQRLEVSFHMLDYMRSSCSSSFADPPNSLGLLSLPCSLSKSPCLLNSTLCRPHVHTHRVAQAGAEASRLADWTHFKFLTVCASRWPLVLVGSDSTFLSAFLTCSSRCFCACFPCGDLASAPPPFLHSGLRSVSLRVWRQSERTAILSHRPMDQRKHLSPHSFFLLSLWADCPCFWLRLCWPMCTHFRAFSNIQGHLFSNYSQPFCVIKFFLKLALPPTGASLPSAVLQQNSLK